MLHEHIVEIDNFLYSWCPDYYSEDFSVLEKIELFELVITSKTSYIDSYSLNSSRFYEELEKALEEYTEL